MSVSEIKIILLIALLAMPCVLNAQEWSSDSLRTERNSVTQDRTDPWLSPDKGLHLIGSTILTVGSAKSLQRFGRYNRAKAANISVSLTLSLGLGKEFYDQSKPRNLFSFKDLAADFLGCGIGLILLNIQ